jgi:hypothetical protein
VASSRAGCPRAIAAGDNRAFRAGTGDRGAGTKVSLDPAKVEQIIEQRRIENSPLAAVAKRIVQSAVVLDKREARILRALLDDDGRALCSYQTAYYRPFSGVAYG